MSRLNVNGSAITDLVGATPIARFGGGCADTWGFKDLGVAEGYSMGEMVCLSGLAGANAVGVTRPGVDASGYGILGFAANASPNAISGDTDVWVATPETIFMANVGHSTSASAQTAATDLYKVFGLTSLSGRTYVDKSKTSGVPVMCRVVGFHEQDDVPAFYGRVHFMVLPHQCQLYGYRSSGMLIDPRIM